MNQFIAIGVPVLIALGGVLIGSLLTWLISKEVARRSGAFKQVDLHVLLMGEELIPQPVFQEVIYGLNIEAKDNDKVFCILKFVVVNQGDLTAKNVKLRIAFPVYLRADAHIGKIPHIIEGAFGESDVAMTDFLRRPFEHSYYKFESLSPGNAALVEEMVEISHASGVSFDVSGMTADNIPIRVKARVLLSGLPLQVLVQAENSPAREGSFTIQAYHATTIEEIKNKVSERQKILKDKSKEKGNPPRLVHIDTIAVIPKLKAIPKPEDVQVEWNAYLQEYEDSKRWLLSRWERQ